MAKVLQFPARIEHASVQRGQMTIVLRDGERIACVVPLGYESVKSSPAIWYFIASAPGKPTIGFSRETRMWEEIGPNAETTMRAAINEGLI